MKPRARAADPATLFRPGGKTIGDHMRRVRCPLWVPSSMQPVFRLDAVFDGEHEAARLARQRLAALRQESASTRSVRS